MLSERPGRRAPPRPIGTGELHHRAANAALTDGTEATGTRATFAPRSATMMEGRNGRAVDERYTVGDFLPLGKLDGIGALELDANTVRLLVNHEIAADSAYVHQLGNDTQLTGARGSYFDVEKATREIGGAGEAYDKVYDRAGSVAISASQPPGQSRRSRPTDLGQKRRLIPTMSASVCAVRAHIVGIA